MRFSIKYKISVSVKFYELADINCDASDSQLGRGCCAGHQKQFNLEF
jgi:hypothetical protein